MGRPVSAVVANLCMEVVEEQAIRKRFVDDSFIKIKKSAVLSFHDTLNSIDPNINFTIKHEQNGQIAFLDTLVSRNNCSISIDVYRKPTHTNRYLDYNSHHDYKHKISTTTTLIDKSLILPTHEESKKRELNRVSDALVMNGYPQKLISSLIVKHKRKTITPSPEELVRTFFESLERTPQHTGDAVLPYIKGVTEPLQRILSKYDIKVFTKPMKTLKHEFPSVKHRPNMEEKTDVVYKIPCNECSWSYISETGRFLKTRKSEHLRNVKLCKKGSKVIKHAWTYDHVIDFSNSIIIDSGSYRTRKTWHTAVTNNADNNSMLLPGQYTMLTKKNM